MLASLLLRLAHGSLLLLLLMHGSGAQHGCTDRHGLLCGGSLALAQGWQARRHSRPCCDREPAVVMQPRAPASRKSAEREPVSSCCQFGHMRGDAQHTAPAGKLGGQACPRLFSFAAWCVLVAPSGHMQQLGQHSAAAHHHHLLGQPRGVQR